MLSDIIAPGRLRAGDPEALAALVAVGGWPVVAYCERAGAGDEAANAVVLAFVTFRRRTIQAGDKAAAGLERILLESARDAVDQLRGDAPAADAAHAAGELFARASPRPLSPRLATEILRALVDAAPVDGTRAEVRVAAERSYADAYAAAEAAPAVSGEDGLAPASPLLLRAADSATASPEAAGPAAAAGSRRAAAPPVAPAAGSRPPAAPEQAAGPRGVTAPGAPDPGSAPRGAAAPGAPEPAAGPRRAAPGAPEPGPVTGSRRAAAPGAPEPGPMAGPRRPRGRARARAAGTEPAQPLASERAPTLAPRPAAPRSAAGPLLDRLRALPPAGRAVGLAGTLVLALLLVAQLSGDDEPASQGATTPPRDGAIAPATAAVGPAAQGDVVRGALRKPLTVRGTRFEVARITDAAWARGVRRDRPRGGARWVTMAVRVRNISRRDLVLRALGYRLLTRGGVIVGPRLIDVAEGPRRAREGRLPVGSRASVHLGFEAPRKAAVLSLALEPGGLGGPTVLIPIG
jgi:hypothetical protein